MNYYEKIEINPEIMCGKPVIKGTRITVELILQKLSEGLTPAEIAEDHPTIKIEDVSVAQAYAVDIVTGVENLSPDTENLPGKARFKIM